MKTLFKLLTVFLTILCALFLTAAIAFFCVTKNTVLDEEKLTLSHDEIAVLDQDDVCIKTQSLGEKNRLFSVKRLPKHTIEAFVDVEDKRFFSHGGIDVKRMAKAAINNLRSRSFKEGASTISQQLIKNTHLSQEKTLQRKLREIKLTAALERRYSKAEILEKYLSSIYFGHDCFGIQSAADFYFSKTPDCLTLAESALLAGLVRSPNNYSPFKNPEKSRNRRSVVLAAMLRLGHIDASEKQAAENEPLPVFRPSRHASHPYISACFDRLEQIVEEKRLHLGGKTIIRTYLNTAYQNEIDALMHESTPSSDAVVALLSHDSCGFSAYYSTCGSPRRSPASLFKPLCAYAPALEEGLLSLSTPIDDCPVDYFGYSPKNYDGKYRGYVSVRECLSTSLNIPAVKTLDALTLQKSRNYLRRVGLQTDDDYSLAAALGGVKNGYTLPELLSAYSVFPRGGYYKQADFIRSIESDGKILFDAEKERADTAVYSPETAFLTLDALKTCAKSGTAKKLRSLPFDVAAKTGTNGDKTGNLDAYAIACTTRETIGVWLGNSDNKKISYTGGGKPCDKIYALEKFLAKSSPPSPFPVPQGAKKITLDKISYERERKLALADDLAPKAQTFDEWFNVAFAPREKSTRFSSPSIGQPHLAFDGKKVRIAFDETAPDYYDYLVEREENGVKTTVYQGKKRSEITDTISSGKTYRYFVTPYYLSRRGNTIVLPSVSTKEQKGTPDAPFEPPDLTKKEWWND